MYDIITFGSGTQDVYLIPKSKDFSIIKEKKFISQKGLCFPFGAKIKVADIIYTTGGGGTNTAATFKNQGFKVAWCGMLGQDISGKTVLEELKKRKIDSSFIFKTEKSATNYSVILVLPEKERTILGYRGASELLTKKDIPWKKLKTKWFYLAPLSGKLCSIFEDLVNFAKRNKIKVVANPGNSQLSLPKNKLERILKKVDILILNKEEASLLVEIPYHQEKKIFQKLDKMCPGIVVMTKGEQGVIVSDGKYLYQGKPVKSRVIDRTGAGDSFSAGFVSEFIRSKGNIVSSIQFGIANSTACLKERGAKNGLLKKGEKFKKVKIYREKI